MTTTFPADEYLANRYDRLRQNVDTEVIRNEYVGVYVPRIGVMAHRDRRTETPSVYVHLDGIETYRGRGHPGFAGASDRSGGACDGKPH